MVDATASARAHSHSPTSTAKHAGAGRQRVISSCLTCRRRKVKCDHAHPVCGSCTRGSHVCTWTDQLLPLTASGRVSKPMGSGSGSSSGSGKIAKNSDVQARLDRLEVLLERAVGTRKTSSSLSGRPIIETDTKLELEPQSTPSSTSQASYGRGVASDDGDGTLLLDGGQSQFVSSLHYALLAEEVSSFLLISVHIRAEQYFSNAFAFAISCRE